MEHKINWKELTSKICQKTILKLKEKKIYLMLAYLVKINSYKDFYDEFNNYFKKYNLYKTKNYLILNLIIEKY